MDLPASRLVDYEGTYQLDEFMMMEVTRDGRRLWPRINGQPKLEQYAERLDRAGIAAASMRINQNLVRTQPRPGGEALLRRNIDLAVEGKVRFDDLTPQFGQQVRRVLPRTTKELAPFGKVKDLIPDGRRQRLGCVPGTA